MQHSVGIIASSQAAGGGGGSYTASAVHFDGSLWLEREPPFTGLTTASKGLFFGWTKNQSQNRSHFRLADTGNEYGRLGFASGGGGPDSLYAFATLASSDLNSEIDLDASSNGDGDYVDLTGWTCQMWAWDTHAGTLQVYVGDVPHGIITNQVGVPFDMSWAFESYFFGWGDYNFSGDASDTRLFVGQTLDLSVEANRRLIISADGKPVAPATLTAALGTAGVVLFSGDHSTFLTNQGTGGTVSITDEFTRFAGNGSNGPGFANVPNLAVGITVLAVHDDTNNVDVTSDFETVTTVPEQVQQTGAVDLSFSSLTFTFGIGTLSNATTSPSD